MNIIKMKRATIFTLLFSACILVETTGFAQKDTLKRTTIDVNSAYKPVLRNAVKINLSASHLTVDSTKPVLSYMIPAENLFYTYRPLAINPVSLEQDSNLVVGGRNFLKLGIGNFSTAYLSGGFGFGDGKKSLVNIYADYISSKGKIKYQDYAQLNIKAAGSYFMPRNELYGSASIRMQDNYLYGYDHSIFDYPKDSVRQQFQDIAVRAGFRNTVTDEYGISYDPNVEISYFNNRNKLTESSLLLNAPLKKHFGESFDFTVNGRADITTYNGKGPNNTPNYTNNIYQVAPSLSFTSPRFSINGGIMPTWDNGKFVWLPNIYAEGQIQDKIFSLQAGWVGRYIKNSFRNLTMINPYLQTLPVQNNTRETEYYGGIKASIGKHFSFNAKAGWVTISNMPLFINDTAVGGKGFTVSNEPSVNDIRVHGDISYVDKDKFSLTAGLTLNGYTGLKVHEKAWNTVPMELTGSLRWYAYKQVILKADLYAFGGGNYIAPGKTFGTFKSGADLSAGIEFKVNKMLSAWLDVNNLLGDKYQRWHNYEVYGLNLVGGVKINF